MTAEIHFEVCPYRHNASTDATPPCTLQAPTCCGVPVAQQMTPFAVGKVWHRRAAKRYVQKLDIGRVHKFGMERVRKFSISAPSELGIGHDIRRAFRTGGIRTWRRTRAVKTNRLVYVYVCTGSPEKWPLEQISWWFIKYTYCFRQCFDTVCWVTGRPSGL